MADFPSTPNLIILGAAWGPKNVTEQVQSMVSSNDLRITADDQTFGDPWFGHRKSLVVVYQYGTELPQVIVAPETFKVVVTYFPTPRYIARSDGRSLTILGAAYGLADITSSVWRLVDNNTLNATLTTHEYDPWPGNLKTAVVVYQYGNGQPQINIVQQGQETHIG